MAINWTKPIRYVHNKVPVKSVTEPTYALAKEKGHLRVDGNCLYKSNGDPVLWGMPIENYEPEPEVKPVTVDWSKPVQHLDGTPLRVLCTDAPGTCPVIVVTPVGTVIKYPLVTTRAINVPEKRTGYLNIYDGRIANYIHKTRLAADANAFSNRIACIKVEYTVGQFDT